MQFLIGLLIAIFMFLVFWGFGATVLFRWIVHTYRRTHSKYRRKKKNVWLEDDPCLGHLFLDDNLRFLYLGSIERFIIKKRSDKEPLGEKVGYVYASFKTARERKFLNAPGVLTYYYYGDKMFFAKFEPYSKEEAEHYFPEIKRNEAEYNYLVIFWGIISVIVAMFILFLVFVVPEL